MAALKNQPQPLQQRNPIVDSEGKPSDYFMRYIQLHGGAITDLDGALTSKAEKVTKIIPGIGIDGGGDLSADRTINLKNTTVVPGTYGASTKVPVITVDQQGRLTTVTEANIAGGGGGSNLGSLEGLLVHTASPSTNFYLLRKITAERTFSLNKIGFRTESSVASLSLQACVYSDVGNTPTTLLGSSSVISSITAGVTEVPLTSTISIAKNQTVWIGVSVTTNALSDLWHGVGLACYGSNGGVVTPASTFPGLSGYLNGVSNVYGFWGIS